MKVRLKRVRALFLFVVAASLWRLAGGGALEATAGGPDAKRVAAARAAMLVLKAECFACHNEEKKKGGLVLTSGEGLLKGGEEGPVVSPGKPEASPLVKALAADADPHMPPKKQLAEAQIKVLRDWVQAGATWNQAALSEEDPKLPVKLAALPAAYQPVLALALSPDGKRLAVARGGSLVLHDGSSTNFPVLAQREAALDAIQCLAWSPDGKRLAAGAWRHLSLWSGDNLKLEREWETGLAGRVTAAQFSPDGTRLVLADGVAGRGGYARVLNLPDGKAFESWVAHGDTVFSLDFSRDGKQLVTTGGDRLIKVWDVATRKETARLEGHTAQVLAVAFNTNATQVLSGGADKQLKVWDIATREKIVTLGDSAAGVTGVAWPGGGKMLVAVTDTGDAFTYRNLKAHTGEQSSASADQRKLGHADEALQCVDVTADGRLVFAGGQDGVVRVWNDKGKLVAAIGPHAGARANLKVRAASLVIPSPTKSEAQGGTSAGPVLAMEKVASISVEPARLELSPDSSRQRVLVTGKVADGFEVDLTPQAKFVASAGAPFRVDVTGELFATGVGAGVLTVEAGGKRAEVSVRVTGKGGVPAGVMTVAPASFVRDVLPVLSKAGCNAGSCHAKADGQNGFKLSVFSYDPAGDYAEIVKEDRGRRVFPAAPAESLILKKPTTTLPHEGGLRFERGSETWQLLTRWIAEGMAYRLTNEPALEGITVFPKERRYHKGARQRLLVTAHYADGSTRDVSRLAAFDSNDKEISRVDERGVVTIGTLTGQGVVVARYMGFVADSQILVPANHLLPEEKYAALPRNNFIDDRAYARFQRLGLYPSDLCTDTEFLRRAKLDAVGLLPTTEEVRAFLADKSPDKRRRFIEQVLDDPAYADYWANKWADLLRPNPDRVGVKSVYVLDQWLRESFRRNLPYDQFVREILLEEGNNHADGPAVIYRDRREPADLTTMFSQLFLGTRFECARCHHHPNEKWSQDDFYQLAAFFGPLKQKGAGLSPPISAGTETFYFAPGGSVKHPVTGTIMTPRPPDGPKTEIEKTDDPRHALADWMTAPENPFFARAAVNRVWANFFGRGLVDPVDDFRISNPCVNPELLDALARDFISHGYDFKHLMRTIMESRLYQLSAKPNETNLADTRNFSRAYRRRLPAETLMDAVNDVTGVPDQLSALTAGARATRAWTYKIDSQFMDAFGRPNASSDCPCERDTQLSVVQSLHLMNSKALQAKLDDASGRVRKLADGKQTPAEIVTELYLAALSRPPAPEELKVATAVFTAPNANRRNATGDVLWALLNSPEFELNH